MHRLVKVSVVIPTHGRIAGVQVAVASVLSQGVEGLEIIVVNDRPQDREELDRRFVSLDNRVRLIHNERNIGAPAARNKGIAAAKGEFIALLDDDDRWLPGKLPKQLVLLEQNRELGFVSCGYHDEWLGKDRFPEIRGKIDRQLLHTFSNIETSTVLMRAELGRRTGEIDVSLPSEQNHDFFYRMAKLARFDYVPEVLVFKSAPPAQISRSPRKKIVGYVRFHRKHRSDIRSLGIKGSSFIMVKFLVTLVAFLVFAGNEKYVDTLYEGVLRKFSGKS